MNAQKAVLRVVLICLRVAVFVAVVLGIVYLGQSAYHYTQAVFSDEAYEEEPGKNVVLKIPEDVSVKTLSEVMEENGLVKDASVFRLKMKTADFGGVVKAGEYHLNSSMKPSEMIRILSGQAEEDET